MPELSPSLRARFPALADSHEVYLDSAATTQKPASVVEAVRRYHAERTANAGRATYSWANDRTRQIAAVRDRMAAFVGAAGPDEIVFTAGATAASNAVAHAWGLANLDDGDEILVSPTDHASTTAPWHHVRNVMARFDRKITLVPYRSNALGEADIADIAGSITDRTRLIVATHLHHTFGTVTTLAELDADLLRCFDCSQSGGHIPVDVGELRADFATFAAHKMFGAPGTGVLYCNRRIHHQLQPFLPGGTTGTRMPELLEGGTSDIPGILALGAALDLIEEIGIDTIAAHNRALTRRLVDGLRAVPGVDFTPGAAYAPCAVGYGIVSFTIAGVSAADVGFALAADDFLVRTGTHCVPDLAAEAESVRVSTHIYNSGDEIDRFVECVAGIAQEVGWR